MARRLPREVLATLMAVYLALAIGAKDEQATDVASSIKAGHVALKRGLHNKAFEHYKSAQPRAGRGVEKDVVPIEQGV